jgi:hypothetical protein
MSERLLDFVRLSTVAEAPNEGVVDVDEERSLDIDVVTVHVAVLLQESDNDR